MKLLALLVPVGALVIAGAFFGALELREDSHHAATAPAQATSSSEPATPQAQPRLAPSATVCQGLLHTPVPGQPQTFPAQYTKRASAQGITIVAGPAVPDEALVAAQQTLDRMFANNDLVKPLAAQGAYIVVAEKGQGILDLPEFACLADEQGPEFFSHVCGITDRADYPVATVNEADLLGDRTGPCGGLNILYHEVGHLVQNWSVDPRDWFDIKQFYAEALAAGKYRGQYAATNPNEYFAEATQDYFLYGDPAGTEDRAWLQSYDPQLEALLARIYGE